MPQIDIRPDVGWRIPAAMRSVVVFPAPFGPRTAEKLTASDGEIDAGDGGEAAVALGELLELNQRPARRLRNAISYVLRIRLRPPGSLAATTRPCASTHAVSARDGVVTDHARTVSACVATHILLVESIAALSATLKRDSAATVNVTRSTRRESGL